MTHTEAEEHLATARSRQAGKPLPGRANNTRLHDRGDHLAIQLHDTDVVSLYPDGRAVLDSGGWRTATTKERINYYMPSPWCLLQAARVWYLSYGIPRDSGNTLYLYRDGITLWPDGRTDAKKHTPATAKAARRDQRRAARYAKALADKLLAGKLPVPGPRDCWFCRMIMGGPDKGRGLGDATRDRDHIHSHLTERYYVPSLLVRAVKRFPVSRLAEDVLARWLAEEPFPDYGHAAGVIARQLRSNIKRYVLEQLGYAA